MPPGSLFDWFEPQTCPPPPPIPGPSVCGLEPPHLQITFRADASMRPIDYETTIRCGRRLLETPDFMTYEPCVLIELAGIQSTKMPPETLGAVAVGSTGARQPSLDGCQPVPSPEFATGLSLGILGLLLLAKMKRAPLTI